MTNSVKYLGTYTDHFGSVQIVVENNFKTMSFEVAGVTFEGSEFSDFSIPESSKYNDEQLARFTFYTWPANPLNKVTQTLCNCTITITVPQTIINTENNTQFETDMELECALSEPQQSGQGSFVSENIQASLVINNNVYSGSGDMESVLLQISNKIGSNYKFKNCWGCMFGDYSAFGSGGFGSMKCFVAQKENYLKVKDKSDYIELEVNSSTVWVWVQEIYCCDKYEIRKQGVGYR